MKDGRIGQRIKACREKKGYTQETLAEAVGISASHLSALERGIKYPSVETLGLIIHALEVSADEIFRDFLESGQQQYASILWDEIEALPQRERDKILAVVRTMIDI